MKKDQRKYFALFPVAILVIMIIFTVGEYLSADTSVSPEKIHVTKIYAGYNAEQTVEDLSEFQT